MVRFGGSTVQFEDLSGEDSKVLGEIFEIFTKYKNYVVCNII